MKPNWNPENVGKKCEYYHYTLGPLLYAHSLIILFWLYSFHSSTDIALYWYTYEELKEVFDALIQYVTSLKTKEDTSATETAVSPTTATTATSATSSTTTTTTGAGMLSLSAEGITLTNDSIFSSNEQDEELEVLEEEEAQKPENEEEDN